MCKGAREIAAKVTRQIGIMVARYPYPVASALQRAERSPVSRRHAPGTFVVVKAIAESDHAQRRVAVKQVREPQQSCRRIVGRQQHAALGKGGAFLQMQIGDDKHALDRPIQRTRGIGDDFGAGEGDCMIFAILSSP